MSTPVKVSTVQRVARAAGTALFSLTPLALGTCVDQPKVNCLTSTNPFAVKLVEESREGSCGSFGPESFNANPLVGLSPYYAKDDKGQPDYAKASVAIQTAELGTYVTTAADYDVTNNASDGKLYSFGPFSVEEPNDQDFCPAPKLSTTHVVLDEVPAVEDDPATDGEDEDESFPGQPAVDIKLEWTNFEIYVTPGILGTQFQADLSDTRESDGDTCTIKYKAYGLSPAVPCWATDDKGDPVVNDDGTYELDPEACNPEADPEAGRFSGSGISAGTDYECDPVIAYCLIKGTKIPAVK